MTKIEPIILIDTREQRPFAFPNSERITLATADYRVRIVNQDFCNRIGIERKSANDLLSCIGGQRSRFEAELERLCEFDYPAVIVEAPLRDILVAPSGLHLNAIVGTLCAWMMRYRLPILFAGNRAIAQMMTERLLVKAAKYAAEDS